MIKNKFIILVGVVGAIAGTIVGLWFGMFLGGNFFQNVSFMGMSGYELFGNVGIITGAILGCYIGIHIVKKPKQNT